MYMYCIINDKANCLPTIWWFSMVSYKQDTRIAQTTPSSEDASANSSQCEARCFSAAVETRGKLSLSVSETTLLFGVFQLKNYIYHVGKSKIITPINGYKWGMDMKLLETIKQFRSLAANGIRLKLSEAVSLSSLATKRRDAARSACPDFAYSEMDT